MVTLLVGNFGMKVVGNTQANHLVETLKKDYDITIDWKGERTTRKTLWIHMYQLMHLKLFTSINTRNEPNHNMCLWQLSPSIMEQIFRQQTLTRHHEPQQNESSTSKMM